MAMQIPPGNGMCKWCLFHLHMTTGDITQKGAGPIHARQYKPKLIPRFHTYINIFILRDIVDTIVN